MSPIRRRRSPSVRTPDPPAHRRRWRIVTGLCVAALIGGGGGIGWVLTRSAPVVSSSPSTTTSTSAGLTLTTHPRAPGSPWRVLVVGDSTAMTLEWALAQTSSSYDADVFDGSTFMCGVAIGTEASSDNGSGPTMAMVPPCNSATPVAQQWPALWRQDLSQDNPDLVVVLAGRWETTDRMYDGHWMNILDRPFAVYVERQLELAVRTATSTGAHVDMLTAACADSGPFFAARHEPDTAVNDDSSVRLAAYNALLRQSVRHAHNASVVDLDALLCPEGQFQRSIDGVQVRPLDGVHTPSYSPGNPFVSNSTPAVADAFATWLAPRLWPELLAGLDVHPH
jgi:hypothetical protein